MSAVTFWDKRHMAEGTATDQKESTAIDLQSGGLDALLRDYSCTLFSELASLMADPASFARSYFADALWPRRV